MRLIDADNVRDLFDAEFKETRKLILAGETHLDNLAEGFTEADRVIRQMPTVDADAVVRCMGCKYWQDNNDGYPHEECRWGHGETPDANDFCSYGERKDDDSDAKTEDETGRTLVDLARLRRPMPVADAERLPGGGAGAAGERELRKKLLEATTPETKEGGHTECLN